MFLTNTSDVCPAVRHGKHARNAISAAQQRLCTPRDGMCACCSPLHACKRCGTEANEAGTPQELVPCRLCPAAYHVACLPGILGGKETRPRRVWLAERDEAGDACL